MKIYLTIAQVAMLSMAMIVAIVLSTPAMAHCDSMDGPVVKDAQRALADQDIEPVLKWVREEDEAEVRDAFDKTLSVREKGEAAKEVADRYFFETLVRIHRASEGEGFTGLKPHGAVDPAIAAADRALSEGEIDALADKFAESVRKGIEHRFTHAHTAQQQADSSVEQGREYVEAYVQFTHFVEAVDHLTSHGASVKHRENE